MDRIRFRTQVIDRMSIMDRSNFYAPGELGKTRRLTPEGFLVCEGVAIARTGEQRYHKSELPGLEADAAGVIVVTRPPEEVFSPRTIASFEGKSVTLEHPDDFITPESWRQHEVGTIHNVRRGVGIEDDMLLADLLIKDGDAIDFVNKTRPEMSCGYNAGYEQTEPGRAMQYNIRGNHVALLTGRGRAGPRCSIQDVAADWHSWKALDDAARDLLPQGVTSMRSKTADKFIRALQAFVNQDAEALEREFATDNDPATDLSTLLGMLDPDDLSRVKAIFAKYAGGSDTTATGVTTPIGDAPRAANAAVWDADAARDFGRTQGAKVRELREHHARIAQAYRDFWSARNVELVASIRR